MKIKQKKSGGTYLKIILCLVMSAALLASLSVNAAELFKGEQIEKGAGFEAITYFAKGDPKAPLIVFIPGAITTARVAYGVHKGFNEKDFIAYWLKKKGYNFLGISYPIDTARGGIEVNYPDFTIRNWGAQAAAIARKKIEEYGLENRVIGISYSMGGKIVQSFHEAARNEKLNLDFIVSLAATPPMPGMIALKREFSMLRSGYADRRANIQGLAKAYAHVNKERGSVLIPEDAVLNDYYGDIPVNIQGFGQQYRDGKFVWDQTAYLKDARPFHYHDFPLVAMILPGDRADARHAMVDKACWTMYNVNTIYKRYLRANKVDLKSMSEAQWQNLLFLTRSIDDRLSMGVKGNHNFFIGEGGARTTADAINTLETRVHGLKAELSNILGVTIN